MRCLLKRKKGNNTLKNAYVDVYYAFFDNEKNVKKLAHKKRNEQINSCSNLQVKRQKYFAWKLLEIAVKKSLGLSVKKFNLILQDNGKCVCDDFYFSLSHTDNLVAVSISNAKTGVDVESLEKNVSEKLAKKALSSLELSEYDNLDENKKREYFITKWSQKESVFKSLNERAFNPKNILTQGVFSTKISDDKKEYILSCFCQNGYNIDKVERIII